MVLAAVKALIRSASVGNFKLTHYPAAIKLATDSAVFLIEWVDDELHAAAVRELNRSKQRRVSLVDHVSFLVMRRRAVTTAFAFDADFTSAGFRLIDS